LRKGASTIVRYTMAAKSEWRPVRERVRVLTPAEHPLVREMTSRGITRDVAELLLKQHSEKSIADKLEVYDHLRAEQSPMVTKNPAGFLRSSIEKDFAPPTGYVPRAERQRQKQEAAETRRRERELKEAAEKTERAHKDQLDALWSSLSASERAQIEDEVLITLNPFARKSYLQEKTAGRIGAGHHALRAGIAQLVTARRGLSTTTDADALRELA
jgi:hypothetical protein